jgi:hypothetical protein
MFAGMPLYHLNLAPGPILDDEGLEFPNDEAAHKEAALMARDLAHNRVITGNHRVVVSREDGSIVHEVYLQDVATLK